MKKILTLLLAYTLIYSSIFNNAYSLGQSTYYTSIESTVYDKPTGQVTRNYNINTSLSELQDGPNNRKITKIAQAKNLANRIRHAALKNNALSLAITAAVTAVGWGIHEITQDLYGNDIQLYNKETTGVSYRVSGDITGIWHSTPSQAVSAHASNKSTDTLIYSGSPISDTLAEFTLNNTNTQTTTDPYTVAIFNDTQTITEDLQDSELISISQDSLTPAQYNEIYAIPDYIPNTIQEVKSLQLDIIKDAYPEQIPFGTTSSSVSSASVVPGTAPEVTEVKINETNTDTTPEELTDNYADPWQQTLPNGQPNPNYDPRTDTNSTSYDSTKDPRVVDSTNIKDAEILKQQTELLRQLKTLQQQQLQQQIETKTQIKNNSKESTQQSLKNALESIDKTLKDTKKQAETLPELKCGGDSGISCEATQSQILTEVKKITSPEVKQNPDVISASENFATLLEKYNAVPIISAVKSISFGFSGQSCITPSINFDILGTPVNGDLSMVCTVVEDIQTELGFIMMFLFSILSLFLLLKA